MGSKEGFIGIDLGGTSIKIGVISNEGQLINHVEVPTRTQDGYQAIISDIITNSKNLIEQVNLTMENIKGMGLGLPGMLDIEEGIVTFAPNLSWRNVPVKSLLEGKLRIPIKLDNDANVAVLGEAWVGAGKGYKHIVMSTIGTGIGSGIIINGEILHGKNGMAAELGHIPISEEGAQCGCGSNDCLETISSATGIIRRGKEIVQAGKSSILTKEYADKVEQITAKSIIDAAKLGDKEALQVVNNAGKLLGRGLAIVANLFDPEIIIIGGGVSHAGEIIFKPIKDEFNRKGLNNIVESVEIVPAILGNQAGMIGAAKLFN